jgi:alkylation response protein AidB-like acyl-CoA dehydrogenase
MTIIDRPMRPAPDPNLTFEDLLQAAKDLVPLLRERAAETDRERRVSDEVYRRLQDAGLFHMLKPKKYGGYELGEHEHAQIVMTLAQGCASTAWVYSILAGDVFLILSYPEEVIDEIWSQDSYATLAGNTNMNQKAKVERVAGGYRLSGSWGFCSGSDFSEWLVFNAPAGEDGSSHFFLVPREEATTVDDWYPTGMRGTGSRTQVVEDVFVPDRRVLPMSQFGHWSEGFRAVHPTFDLLHTTVPPVGLFDFAAVAVGAAWGAVEHFAATAASSTRVAGLLGGAYRMTDSDYIATEFAEAAGDVQMAMHTIHRQSAVASERARLRRPTTELEIATGHRDYALVTRTALRSVNRIYSLVGAKAGKPDHPVSLAKRDIEMLSHHVTLNWLQSAKEYFAAVIREQ